MGIRLCRSAVQIWQSTTTHSFCITTIKNFGLIQQEPDNSDTIINFWWHSLLVLCPTTMSFLKQLEEMIMKESEDYYRMMKETYFEAYYDQIEDFTFKSVILPMTLEDTQALMDAYTMYMDGTDKEVDLSVVDAKIDKGIALIREKAKKDCKVFVRLSSRSPKDAIYHLESFPNLIQ